MSLEKSRAQVTASIWQAIAQSGVDLSSVSQDEQEKLVRVLSDQMLIALDGMLDEMQEAPAQSADDDADEKMLWQGRPFLSLVESYVITSERLKIIRGLIGRDIENFELIRMQDIDYKQNVSERILGIGDITIRGADASDAEVVLRNVGAPEEVYEILRRAWLEARKRHGLQFREFM